jgi:hypothetical protein
MLILHRWIAERRFRGLVGEARRRGAAAGRFGIEDNFPYWAEAMVRPVVYIVYGPPSVAPELLAAQRQKLEVRLEGMPAVLPPEGSVQVSVSYPLAAVVLLSGALTGLVLDLSALHLGPKHWAAVAISALWLTAVLHVLPVGVCACARLFRRVWMRWRTGSLSRAIARLEAAEHREQRRAQVRAQSIAERVEVLVQTFDYYRAAGRVAVSVPYRVAA